MSKKTIVLALALVVALALPAFAEVEEVTVGGSIQVRGQVLTPGVDPSGSSGAIGFDDDINENDWITQRTRVNVDAKLSGGVRGFVELQSYDFWGTEAEVAEEIDGFEDGFLSSTTGGAEDDVDLYQAYIEMNDIADYPFMLRIGRQELVYGREWLVGNNDAGVDFFGLSFDAVKASYNDDLFQIDAWWSKLEENTAPSASEVEQDGDVDFYGVYGTYKGLEDIAIDGYWLFVRDGVDSGSGFDNLKLHTVGARGAGMWDLGAGVLDANIEAAFQFGDNGEDGDYEGWAFNAMAGYTFNDVQWSPRLEGEYVYFSGDDDAADEDSEEFVRLFSDVHYGELNLGGTLDAAATNLHIFKIGGSIVPVERLTLKADFYYFLLAEDDEEGGATTFGIDQGTASADDNPGYELDIVADYQYTEDLNLRVGWAHFFADDAIENSWGAGTSDDDVDYVYAQAMLVF
ncbi:MAG: alginate export family protein [Candidatus Abyssubacteria bacterium]